jgi:autotransporter-associated beta strand protein
LSCYGSAIGTAAEIRKANNNTNLNLSGSWQNGTIPGASDVMVWDSLVTSTWEPDISTTDASDPAPALAALGADRSVAGIKVGLVGGTRHQDGRVIGFENPGSANTLTLGSSGIDMSAATQTLFMQSKVLIGANQTWIISNANTSLRPAYFDNFEDLAFQAMAASTPFNFGGKTVTTTGDGQVTVSSGYNLTNGTLDVDNALFVIQGGTSRTTTLGSDLNLKVHSGRLRLQSNSGASGVSLTSAANIEVFGGTIEMRSGNSSDSFSFTHSGPIILHSGTSLHYVVKSEGPMTTSGNITIAGDASLLVGDAGNPPTGTVISGNLLGSANLTYKNIGTSLSANAPQIRLTGNNSGYSGKITIDGTTTAPDLRLTSATAGSASATWTILANNTLEVDGVSVQLGKLEGSGKIRNSHASIAATLNIGQGEFGGTIEDGSNPTALNKVGPGTLVLNGTNTYTGGTTVSLGTLVANTTLGGTITVTDQGTLSGTGPLDGSSTVQGAISPGTSVGQLDTNDTLTLAPGSDLIVEIGEWTGTTPGVDWDYLNVNSTLSFTSTAANKLVIQVAGPESGFTETAKVLEIARGTSVSGFNVANIQIDPSSFVGYGTWTVRRTGNAIELVYAPASSLTAYQTWTSDKGLTPLNRDPAADADGDGQNNRVEFALNGDPHSGTNSAQIFGKVASVGGSQVLTITLPVRSTALFSGSTEKTLTADGLTYRVQATDDLNSWNLLIVSEVTGSDATAIRNSLGLSLTSGAWTYRVFRSPGPVSGDPREFLRVLVD